MKLKEFRKTVATLLHTGKNSTFANLISLAADTNFFIGALAAQTTFFDHFGVLATVTANDFHNSAQYLMTNTHAQLTHLFFCEKETKSRYSLSLSLFCLVLSSPTSKLGNRGSIQLN